MQLRSLHRSSYDHFAGNKSTISLILHIHRVFCLVTNNDKLHIYIVCKLYASLWHVSITIRPGPNSPSPTSAILYNRNFYDRYCFPTVRITDNPFIWNRSPFVYRKNILYIIKKVLLIYILHPPSNHLYNEVYSYLVTKQQWFLSLE